MEKRSRVAVIGAGPCGLAQLVAFQSAKQKDAEIPEVVCFEKQSDIGGLWNYTWRTGVDEYGEPVHGSMYRFLWSNAPKEVEERSVYTFDEHFGKPTSSFPPRSALESYVIGAAKKYDVMKYIRLNTTVLDVRSHNEKFTVTVRNQVDRKEYSEDFDYVVVASGHFSFPNIPYFNGIETFNGRVLHSHDFRSALEFKGKDILLVGSSYSEEDIGSQCWKYGCKSVTISYRTRPPQFKWPDCWSEVPLLQNVEGNTCTFKDGSKKDVDVIMLCTGYLHLFPFMADNLKLKTKNILYPRGLYNGVVFVDNPKCMYLGMQDQFYTFSMFDLQAWYARDVIMGRIKLPSKEEMLVDVEKWHKEEQTRTDAHGLIDFQGKYCQVLADMTDYPKFNIRLANEALYKWVEDKLVDIMAYRDQGGFESPITGTLSVAPSKPWVEEMDDSLKSFVEQ